jgi:hypothetical protein
LKQWLHFPTNGSLSDEVSTSSTTADFFSFLLTATSLIAADLPAGKEDGAATKEECVPFFFTTEEEAGTTFFPKAIPCLFMNPGGRTRTSSSFIATDDEGAGAEEGVNCPVPGSLRQWRLSGLFISKGGNDCGSGEEARGVEGGGGEGGEVSEAKCE